MVLYLCFGTKQPNNRRVQGKFDPSNYGFSLEWILFGHQIEEWQPKIEIVLAYLKNLGIK